MEGVALMTILVIILPLAVIAEGLIVYHLMRRLGEWQGRLLFLESSKRSQMRAILQLEKRVRALEPESEPGYFINGNRDIFESVTGDE